MRILTVDRFEGTFVICEDKDKKMFAIEKSELPLSVLEGDVLSISDEGAITVDKEATRRRREKIARMQNKLFR